jgi:hypothetical protein
MTYFTSYRNAETSVTLDPGIVPVVLMPYEALGLLMQPGFLPGCILEG